MKKCWIPVLIAAFVFLSGYAVAQNDSGDAAESSEKRTVRTPVICSLVFASNGTARE